MDFKEEHTYLISGSEESDPNIRYSHPNWSATTKKQYKKYSVSPGHKQSKTTSNFSKKQLKQLNKTHDEDN